MTRTRILAAGLLALMAAGALAAPAGALATDPVGDAAAALRSQNLYVGDPAAKLDRDAVTTALNDTIKIAVLPDGAGNATAVAQQIGQTLDPAGRGGLTVGVVVGRNFSAASSRYSKGYAASQAKQAVNAHLAELKAGGDHPDLTALLEDFAARMKSGPAAVPGDTGKPGAASGGGSAWPWLAALGILGAGGLGGLVFYRRRKNRRALELARAKVMPYYDRLANEVNTLDPKGDATAMQALADAGERFTSAGSQLATADSVEHYAIARRTVLEGLVAARTARTALGLDPGPDIPAVDEIRGEQLTEARQVSVQGQQFQGYPSYTPGAPYFFGGGYGVPGGWYSTPFWETLLIGSVLTGGFGGGWGGGGYERGYESGYDAGRDVGQDAGQSGGDWGGGGGDWGGGGGGDWGGGGGDSGGSW